MKLKNKRTITIKKTMRTHTIEAGGRMIFMSTFHRITGLPEQIKIDVYISRNAIYTIIEMFYFKVIH